MADEILSLCRSIVTLSCTPEAINTHLHAAVHCWLAGGPILKCKVCRAVAKRRAREGAAFLPPPALLMVLSSNPCPSLALEPLQLQLAPDLLVLRRIFDCGQDASIGQSAEVGGLDPSLEVLWLQLDG